MNNNSSSTLKSYSGIHKIIQIEVCTNYTNGLGTEHKQTKLMQT